MHGFSPPRALWESGRRRSLREDFFAGQCSLLRVMSSCSCRTGGRFGSPGAVVFCVKSFLLGSVRSYMLCRHAHVACSREYLILHGFRLPRGRFKPPTPLGMRAVIGGRLAAGWLGRLGRLGWLGRLGRPIRAKRTCRVGKPPISGPDSWDSVPGIHKSGPNVGFPTGKPWLWGPGLVGLVDLESTSPGRMWVFPKENHGFQGPDLWDLLNLEEFQRGSFW